MKQYILNTKKIKKISLSFLALMIGILLFFSTFQYTAPFIIALFAAMILDPWISLARKKTRLPRNVVTLFSVFILLSLIFFLIYLVVSRLVFEAKNLLDTMPALATEIYNNILNMTDSSNAFWLEFPEEFIEFIMQFLEDLVASLGEFTNILIPRILDTAFSIPSAVIFFLITVIATYFFPSDKQLIIHYVEEQISPEIFEELRRIKNKIVFTLKKMLKAYLIIIAITFTELFIGFTLLGIEYAFVLASIIAIVDILPVLGTGGFLVPWA
ncbi:MAG TPA: hypothetical protein DHN33_07760, partial [Eubacteriaceae bacterium]|nr:hypothetical protein [Eubacteriaceae bacterium]